MKDPCDPDSYATPEDWIKALIKAAEPKRKRRMAKKCKFCGKRVRTEEESTQREDPYAAELDDDHTKMIICNLCWDSRNDDI